MANKVSAGSVSDLLQSEFGVDSTRNFIDGKWRRPESGNTWPIENPSTGETAGQIARGSTKDIDDALRAARKVQQGAWGFMTATERGRIMMKVSQLVLERADSLARIEALDVGKPLGQSLTDAKALARYFEFYAGAADKLMGYTVPYQAGFVVRVEREPYGVVAIIIPWNYPMQIIGRAVGGALAAGNAVVIKPSEDASATTLAVAAIAHEAGLPRGALNVVCGLGGEVGSALSGHPGADYVSFTGSVKTGSLIQAAAARNVRPISLELGGKSPHIVFDDCDLDHAMPTLVGACMQNAGQTCSAASRVLVQRGVYDEVKRRMAEIYSGLTAGPAMENYDLGPIISAMQQARVTGYIDAGKADLHVAAEGSIASGAPKSGHYVRATLFSEVPASHKLFQEEVFGPVQVLTPFKDEEEAVCLANGTPYGLVAGVWTRDGGRQMRMARRLRCGQVFVNNYGAGGGIELPFGGVGASGHGREKGFEALYEFTQLKTITTFHGA
ncbi:MAG: aldehyde dehydrogenase family protein [Rhodanobacteraceae bacterium]